MPAGRKERKIMTFEDLFHNLNQQTGQGAGAGAARPQRARKPRKAIGTPLTRTLLNLLVTLVWGRFTSILPCRPSIRRR